MFCRKQIQHFIGCQCYLMHSQENILTRIFITKWKNITQLLIFIVHSISFCFVNLGYLLHPRMYQKCLSKRTLGLGHHWFALRQNCSSQKFNCQSQKKSMQKLTLHWSLTYVACLIKLINKFIMYLNSKTLCNPVLGGTRNKQECTSNGNRIPATIT